MFKSRRETILARLVLVGIIALTLFAATGRATANVTTLVLGRRTCATASAFVLYDSFSEGVGPFYAVFAADLNDNGVFGEAGEGIKFVKIGPGGTAGYVRGDLTFPAVREGTTIAVTAYEADSAGNIVSQQLGAVRYTCTHRPATDLYPPNSGLAIPTVGITAKITATAVQLYPGPSARSGAPIGGLAQGTLINVIGRNERGDWLQVQFGGGSGWMMWVTNALIFGPYKQLPITG